MKYYLIAGETSGDLHGANLIQHIKHLDSEAEIRFWGGDLMLAEGGTMVKHYKETAFMGISDVLKNLSKIKQNLRLCKQDLLNFKPHALVLIDYPGFNLRIAQFGKLHGLKTHYYISPKVWAWNNKRAYKIKRDVDYLYSILPFEIDFFKPYGVQPDYVGNPICDAIEQYPFDANFKINHQITKPIIALMPGSRVSEIKHILPAMLSVRPLFPDYEFVLAGANHINESLYQSYIGDSDIKLIKGKTYDVVSNAHAALVCSGTATLETALLNCPQVVCYRFSNLSYQIGKRLIKVKFISLVNLIMDKLVVSELIQGEMTTQNIKLELQKLMEGEDRKNQLHSYAALKIKVGSSGASARVALLLYDRTKKQSLM